MAKNFPQVNLVKTRINFTDQFIKWALTIGRLLVVVVELVALSMFLYRFTLDRQLIDLRTKISAEAKVVSFLQSREDTYRNLQERLALVSTFSKQNDDQMKILNDIISFAPQDVTFNSLNLVDNSVKINADVGSVSSLTDFADKLKNYSKTDSVSIDSIENHSSNASIAVTITVILKGGLKNAVQNQ